MPLNQLKNYNELLEIGGLGERQRHDSLKGIFKRDFIEIGQLEFKKKKISPTTKDGEIPLDTLFTHLTTQVVDDKTKKREFELRRSERLHWVRFHIECRKEENLLVFSVAEPEGNRTYLYDKVEKYVVVLEPLRTKNEYYLLTAFNVRGKDEARNKFDKKYKRRLQEVL